jgi:hypothetical protein
LYIRSLLARSPELQSIKVTVYLMLVSFISLAEHVCNHLFLY